MNLDELLELCGRRFNGDHFAWPVLERLVRKMSDEQKSEFSRRIVLSNRAIVELRWQIKIARSILMSPSESESKLVPDVEQCKRKPWRGNVKR
jgi:hypothetical protein